MHERLKKGPIRSSISVFIVVWSSPFFILKLLEVGCRAGSGLFISRTTHTHTHISMTKDVRRRKKRSPNKVNTNICAPKCRVLCWANRSRYTYVTGAERWKAVAKFMQVMLECNRDELRCEAAWCKRRKRRGFTSSALHAGFALLHINTSIGASGWCFFYFLYTPHGCFVLFVFIHTAVPGFLAFHLRLHRANISSPDGNMIRQTGAIAKE